MEQFFCIGEIRYDVYLPKKQKTNHKKIECIGGLAASAAILLSKWEQKTTLIGAIGQDLYADLIIAALVNAKIRTKYIHSFQQGFTKTGYFIGNEYHEFYDEKVVLKPITIENKSAQNEDNIFIFDNKEFDGADEIVKSVSGTKILFASEYNQELQSLALMMDYVILPKDAEELMSGINRKDASVEAIYEKLEKRLNTNIILIDPNDGCFMKIEGKYVRISLPALGENTAHLYPAFAASFAYFLNEEKPMLSCLKLAWVTAILATKKPGFYFSVPTLKEVLSYDQ